MKTRVVYWDGRPPTEHDLGPCRAGEVIALERIAVRVKRSVFDYTIERGGSVQVLDVLPLIPATGVHEDGCGGELERVAGGGLICSKCGIAPDAQSASFPAVAAATRPSWNHTREDSPRTPCATCAAQAAIAAAESTVTLANVWCGTAEMPVPSAVQRVLEVEREKLRQAPIAAEMRIEDPTLLAATRAGYADLQATLQETLDWMNIRAIAAAGLAELHALAMSGEPATGSLTQSDLQRLRARIDEWLPGQPPRTLDDMRNGNEGQRLQREVDRLRALLGGR